MTDNVKKYMRLVAKNMIVRNLDGQRFLYEVEQAFAFEELTPDEKKEANQLVQDIFEEFL